MLNGGCLLQNWNYVRHHGILAEGPEVTPVEQSVPDKMAMYHDTIYSTMQGFPNEGFRSSEHQTPSNDDDTKVVVPPAYDEIDFVILPSYDEALKDASIAWSVENRQTIGFKAWASLLRDYLYQEWD